jgi:hypothetical protein
MPFTPQSSVLKDKTANDVFFKNGYVKYGRIDDYILNEIIQLNKKLSIPDYFGCGFNVGMNSDIKELRKAMQDEIKQLIEPYTTQLLNEYESYTASFLNKLPRKDCFVIAHQDFTYTDETQYPSFMCFIPLVDTTIHNAALGFIPGSHNYYDYIRAFPFPGVPTPVTENCTALMPYFDIINMKAGEMVFFSHNTIHGSFSNYSGSPRPAVGLSFIHKNTSPYLFIHNPKTNGKTILKYEVDNYFLVEYNNPAIKAMYESGNAHFPYPLLDEIVYNEPETGWDGIHQKLKQGGLTPNHDYENLVNRFNRLNEVKSKKGIYYRIKEKFI